MIASFATRARLCLSRQEKQLAELFYSIGDHFLAIGQMRSVIANATKSRQGAHNHEQHQRAF